MHGMHGLCLLLPHWQQQWMMMVQMQVMTTGIGRVAVAMLGQQAAVAAVAAVTLRSSCP
jgi:hypothetical protein